MPLKTCQDELPALNLTPMIDVVFLLIVFFMVGTRFTSEDRKIKLQLPAVGQTAALTTAPQKRVVQVYRDGRIELDGRAVTIAELTESLRSAKSQYAGLSVAVRGDAQGPFQNVASVIAACRVAGIHDLAISVRLAGSGGQARY